MDVGYSHHAPHIRPSGVRPLNHPECVQKAWGFFCGAGNMRVRRIAVLIDGGFFLKRLPKLVEPQFRSKWPTRRAIYVSATFSASSI
jgi:hypothetical protein